MGKSKLPIIGGSAKKEGQYVWKKCTEIEHIHLSFSHLSREEAYPTLIEVSSSTIDISKYGKDLLVGRTITWDYNGGKHPVEFITETTATVGNSSNRVTYSFDPTSRIITLETTFYGYITWDDYDNDGPLHPFVDFVVSNDPTAYPDGGIHTDGYWYEKFQLEPTLFGYTKISVDKFTFASNIGSQKFVTHHLGVVPKMAIIIGKSVSGGLRYMFTRPEIERQSQLNGYVFTLSGSNYSLATSSIKFNVDANRLQNVDNAYVYQGGKEYTLITMA